MGDLLVPDALVEGMIRETEELRSLLRKGKVLEERNRIDSLLSLVRECWEKLLPDEPPADEVLYALLRAEIMLYASLDDYFDQVPTDLSEKILDRGAKMVRSLEFDAGAFVENTLVPGPPTAQALRLFKNRLAYLHAYSNELYRRDEIPKSLEVVERLYEGIRKLKDRLKSYGDVPDFKDELKKQEYHVDGLLARVCTQRAKCHRQRMEYQSSRKFYSEALQAYLDAARKRPAEYSYYLKRTAMIIAGGSGFINLSRGLLTRATLGIRSAQMMLLPSRNLVYNMYLRTLSAGILRAQSGHEQAGLIEAREELLGAYKALEGVGHFRYMLLAANELVLACVYLGYFAEAFNYIREIRRLAEGRDTEGRQRAVRTADSSRWLITADLLESLARRHQGGAHAEQISLSLAEQAEVRARRLGFKRSRLEALILQGEALFELGRYSEARKAFLDARDLNQEEAQRGIPVISDQHLHVVSLLYLCRISIRTDHPSVAQGHYDEVRKFSTVEHKWVETLRARTESEMTGVDELFPLRGIPEGGYKAAHKELQKWLIRQARKKYGPNLTRIAEEGLGLSRGALYKWFSKEELEELLNSAGPDDREEKSS
ncbi:MAG TPA: hypothetical protein VFD58_31275 [Blastocatellia bacterium]|nr:hypothetical protein [Blastocatellia bacterium]